MTYKGYKNVNNLRQIFWIEKTDVAYAYLEDDMTLDYTWTISEGNTLYLCLNGHTLNLDQYMILLAQKGGTLYLCDCSTDHTGTVSGGSNRCVSVSDASNYASTFNMYGGTLKNGTASTGGGVEVSNGIMNMYGGTIEGNTATSDGGGIYVGTKGTLNLYGGTITNNTVNTNEAHHGGGIYVESNKWSGVGKISISGSPVVTGNTRTYTPDSTTSTENVYLSYGFTNSGELPIIQLGTLTSGANIGIWAGESVFSTASDTDYSGYFSSDQGGYYVAYNGEKKLELKAGEPHVHSGGTAYCNKKAVCEICDMEYGDFDRTNHSGKPGGWCKDETKHWMEYSCCGAIINNAAHHGGKATCMDQATCEACGQVYGETGPHSFTKEAPADQYLKSEATCTEKAVYYKSCVYCHQSSKGTEEEATFEYGDLADHDYGAWTPNGDDTHTRTCSHDESHTETEACAYGDNWETNRYSHWHTCTVCGGETKRLNHTDQDDDHLCDVCGMQITEHEFTAETADANYLKSKATCTEKAVYYKSCKVCGLSSKGTDEEATFESGDFADHDYGEPSYTWTEVPDGYMCAATKACKNCGEDIAEIAAVTYALVTEPTCLTDGTGRYTATFSTGFPAQTKDIAIPATGHDWGKAELNWIDDGDSRECTAARVCNNDSSHKETETVKADYTIVIAPTCLTPGQGMYSATFEAEWANAGSTLVDVTIPALGHDWGKWTSNGDDTHTRVCSRDDSHKETKDCAGGTANCHDKAVCTDCGQAYGKLAPAKHDGGTELKNKKDATCTEKGYSGDTYCKGCGEKLSDGTEIPAIGHSYGAWTVIQAPKAGAKGMREHTCVNCSHKETEAIRATGKFDDVPAGSYYEEAVIWAAGEGITEGTKENLFSPNAICTRAQAVTFLWRAAGSPAPKTSTMPFTDVPADSYYYNAVLWAVENGITKGTSETTFSPGANCTRAHTVTFLWRAEQSPAASGSIPFTDVDAKEYYADAVLWAVNNGITKGTGETTFSPNAGCTRAQIVTLVWRCKVGE